MTAEHFVSSSVNEGIATVTLNRPPVNVLHIPMLEELEVRLTELSERPEVRVLVLRAEGKMFSAGVDVADHTQDKVGDMIPLMGRVCVALTDFLTPTIAAVHGHALGGGCELVLCCDLAVMADHARIGQPEIQLAAIAPFAALLLPRVVGYRAAADILFSGRQLTANEALKMGLVNAVVPVEDVAGWTAQQAQQIAGLSRAAQVLNKRALHMGVDRWAESLPEMDKLYLEELMVTADAEEGLAAFLEKRQPEWKHE